MLNEYFTVLTEATYNHEGTIFNMAGDSLLVGFNVPFQQPDAAVRAWRTAVDMLWRFSAVAAGWRERHGVATGIGIGISQGPVIIGNVGSPHFMSYTVIGNTVNIAARLKELALVGEVLVTSQFYQEVRRLVPDNRVESRGEVNLRGKAETVKVYSIRP
jgi:class 3 adenylate cyclase